MRVGFVAVASLVLWLACDSREAPEWAPPTSARATLVMEPPVLAVGEVARLDLAIVTPPGQVVRPPEGPASTSGLAILERSPIETREERSRWVHHITMRVRALEVGAFELAAGEVEIETPEGALEVLPVPALAGEVVSVFPDHAAQGSPYGVRRLPLGGLPAVGVVGAFVAGAGLAFASVAFVALLRRRMRAPVAAPVAEPPTPQAFETVTRSLAAAREQASNAPRQALDAAAQALRRYADARFNAGIAARTVEELARTEPPFLLTTRWPAFLALLRDLDGERFPRSVEPDAVSELLDRALAFVSESAPTDPP